MTQKRFIAFMALGFVVLIFTYIQKEQAIDKYKGQKEELLIFEKEAKEFGVLKLKHNDKKATDRVLKSLNRIKNASKDYSKSGGRVLEFDDLNVRVLNQLIKKIQNSSLEISKFEIIRKNESSAKIKMEIKQ